MIRRTSLAILTLLAVVVLTTGVVSAGPRQQTVVDTCGRTQVVQDAILGQISGSPTCSTVTDTQLASVTRLEFSGYPNSSIPPADFAGLTGLTYLAFFSPLALTTVPDGAFADLIALETLTILSSPNLATLGADAFDGLTNLTTLDLADNLLTTLDADIFDGLAALETLNLSGNSLRTLDADIFDGTANLNRIDLSYNLLTTLDADIFDGTANLNSIDLTYNLLTTLDADIFDGTANLNSINLAGNLLTTLDADIFDGLTNLGTLDLARNLLTTLGADIFDGTALRDLRLGRNSLTALDTDIFDGLTALEVLNLHDNSLTALPVDIFDGLTGLEHLQLNCNYFTTLDLGIFDPFAASLTYLDLESDSFTTAPSETAIRAKFSAAGFDVRTGTRTCARMTASPTSLTVAEGSTGMYSVTLRSRPNAQVTVAVTSDNTDVTVSPTSLTFSSSNWDTAQTLTVSAAQDTDRADESATLILDPSSSGDTDTYERDVVSSALTVTVTDNDVPGVTVTPTSLAVDEGSTGTYTVELDTQPTAQVTVTINDPTGNTDVTANPASLMFSTSNWATPQTVTVRAAEDGDSLDDTATVTHAVSGGDYGSVTAADVEVTVTDNDTPGVTASPTSLTIGEGSTGTYTVVLDTQPTGDVTVNISSRGSAFVSSSPSSLTFTTSNWNSARTVTVRTFQDDDATDGTATLKLDPSGADYGSVSNASVTVTVTDDDTRGVTVTPTSLPINEGGTGTYTVVLDTQPTSTVAVTINDPTDNADVTASPSSLTFFASNWNTAQTVTVSATEDSDSAQDTATVTHTVAGADYGSVTAAAVGVTVTDDDMPGVTVSPLSLTINEGDTGTYTIVLDTEPTGAVEVRINVPSAPTDVTADPVSLTFTTSNWDTAQTVTVSAAEDDDSAQDTATVTHFVSGANYGSGSVTAAAVGVTVTDNDTPGVTASPTSLTIDEGSTGTYTVALNTQPTAQVTVAIGSDNPDVTVSSSSLTFTTSNWDSAQTVTVTAGQDADTADDTAVLTLNPDGGDYASVSDATVTVTVTDDDLPGICGRTQVVQDAILTALGGSPACEDVTDTQLASVTDMELFFYPPSSILPADFAGLTGLTFLSFTFAPALTTVPDDAFADLTSLETLDLSSLSTLTTLGADAFAGLTNLTTLDLSYNDLTTLPADVFDGLAALEYLDLSENLLTTLDEDIFDGLTNLEILW